MLKRMDYFVIGEMKGGTTSLYHYLIQHPRIVPLKNRIKETYFFDEMHPKTTARKGIDWYQSLIPDIKDSEITGEAAASYLHSKTALNRVYNYYPNAKIIILVRNPVDRAYSHYCHVKDKIGNVSFEKALEMEDKKDTTPNTRQENFNFTYLSFKDRGKYIGNIKRWKEKYKDVLVIKSDDLKKDTLNTVNNIYEFLEVEKLNKIDVTQLHKTIKDEMRSDLREYLENYFKPYNKQLEDYLNIKL